MKLVQVKSDGNMVELDEPITTKNIRKLMREISKVKKILHLYNWSYENSMIQCYGCLEGKAGKENKHELPPYGEKINENIDNSDTLLLFNDIYIVRIENKKYLNLDVSEYGLFYNLCFDGFVDCVTDSDNENDDEDTGSLNELDDVSSLNSEYESSSLDSDYELDEDCNEY